MHSAAEGGFLDCLRILLDAGAEVDARDDRVGSRSSPRACDALALQDDRASAGFSSRRRRSSCLTDGFLLSASAARGAAKPPQTGVTALHEACMGAHTACVKLLLERGASVHATDHGVRSCPPRLRDRCGDWSRILVDYMRF